MDDPAFDRLHKIRLVVSFLQEKFESLYYPPKEILIDESMIRLKGKLRFKQQMPLKPVKLGIKMFVLSESQFGYCTTNFKSILAKREMMTQIVVNWKKLVLWLLDFV